MAITQRFAWDANTEPDLAGYKLYVGRATGSYTVPGSPIDVGNVLAASYDLTQDGIWFFVLTAYNATGGESDFSNEVQLTYNRTGFFRA